MKETIKLRKLTLNDLELVLGWRNTDSVRLNMYNHDLITVQEHEKWFQRCLTDQSIVNLIFERSGIPMGFVSFSKINYSQGRAEWAFYSGDITMRGIGTLMELCALKYAFETLKLRKLSCEVLEFNYTIVKFHKKFGFKEEGVLRAHYSRGSECFDIYLLSIFKDDWHETYLKFQDKFLSDYEIII